MTSFSGLQQIRNMSRAVFEQTCKDNTEHVYIGNDTILCKVLSKHKMYVDSKDLGISPHLIMDGYWESWITLLMADIIQPGFICIDIGANFGYFSILMSELSGSSGKTFAIEPNPGIAELLRCTRFVNGGHFEVIETAFSNKSGEAILTINDRELGGGTIKPNELRAGQTQLVVQTTTVDQLIRDKNIGRVDLIKMDVEGAEPLVFEGMKETIEANPEIRIIIEYSPSIYENAPEFTEYLFNTFTVFQVKNVDAIKELSRYDIPAMVSMNDHTDLYLRRKKGYQ